MRDMKDSIRSGLLGFCVTGIRALASAFMIAVIAVIAVPYTAVADEGDFAADRFVWASKSKVSSKVGPYEDKRRWRIYSELNKSYVKLWLRTPERTVASMRTVTFDGFPYLTVEDRDRDGTVDFYAYFPSRSGGDTQEFGTVFDLADDGTPDWLVFYGGSMISDKGGFSIAYWSHHAIDRNNDGSFDTLVIDCVDKNDDGKIEEGRTAWIYDLNFDGRIDSAEFIEKGRVERIKPANGRLDTKVIWMDKPLRIGEPFGGLFDKIGKDIARILSAS